MGIVVFRLCLLKNRLDIGDKDRFEKSQVSFQETHLVSLRHDILEIPGYFIVRKKRLKIQLNIRSVHVLNKDFIEQKPTIGLVVKKTTNCSLPQKIQTAFFACIKNFVKV